MKQTMKQTRNIIITSLVLASFAVLFAHGGFDHVQGTVIKVDNNVLTVKTTKGETAVKLNAKTEITRDGHPAQAVDLKTGARVVVDVAEGDKDNVAHSIKIGAASKAAPAAAAAHDHDHDSHK
jgi:hypothetical protein